MLHLLRTGTTGAPMRPRAKLPATYRKISTPQNPYLSTRSFCAVTREKTDQVIGIDLGTTNSCVSIALDDGKTHVIANDEGNRTTPSVVAFTSAGDLLVGGPARRQALTNPEGTIFAAKRLIGRSWQDPSLLKHFKPPYKIVKADGSDDAWVEVNKKKYSPSQIGAFVLTKMKSTAEAYLRKEVTRAVITVPAYFNDNQRTATKEAGLIAGLTVERIINEPTAAALAYGMQKQTSGERTIAVYDLGGGTFDVSILKLNAGTFEVLATNGDTFLGGEDFDKEITDFIFRRFREKEGIDLKDNMMCVQRVKEAAEAAKKQLDHAASTEIDLPYFYNDGSKQHHLSLTMTRDELNQIAKALVERTTIPCNICLKDAKLAARGVNEVLLVGGMSRMPAVQQHVAKLFGRPANKSVNPDEAVAVGAALQGSVLRGKMGGLLLLDVTPLSLGINLADGSFSVIIPKNSKLPIKNTQTYTTTENFQTQIEATVYQGDSNVAKLNEPLGTFTFSPVSRKLAGEPKIHVSFALDVSGIVHITAEDKDSGGIMKTVVATRSGTSKKELNRMIQETKQILLDAGKNK